MENKLDIIIIFILHKFHFFFFVKAANFNLAISTNYLQDSIGENRIEFWHALPPVLPVQLDSYERRRRGACGRTSALLCPSQTLPQIFHKPLFEDLLPVMRHERELPLIK